MKRVFTVLFFLLLIGMSLNSASAEGDLWDNFGDTNFYGNDKAVSEKEFQEAIDSKKGVKPKKPKRNQGKTIQQSNETEFINQLPQELPVITITVPIKLKDNAVLPVGHYQVTSEKRNGQIYLKLYQGHYLMAQFPAVETLEDYDMPEINFAGFVPEDVENHYKIIFGSLDYNAFSQVEGAEDLSEIKQ